MRPPRRLAAVSIGALALILGAFSSPALAAQPSSGVVSSANPQVAWTGGPLVFTGFGFECDPAGPTCDLFDMKVGALAPEADDVVISVAAGDDGDVLVIYVYGPDGTIVAEDTTLSANPQVALRNPAPGTYSVRVEAFLGGAGPVSYSAVAAITDAGAAPDVEVPCNGEDAGLGPPPQAVIDAALADVGRVVRLDVLVLLDGVDETFARAFFERVAIPYAELDIVVVPVFQAVPAGSITSDLTTEIIDQTKALVPGRRVPAEFDVVELLTHRDIEALGQKAVAGQAECIGGVAFKEHSFNVSEAQQDSDPAGIVLGPARLVPDQAAKITAHEIGHLFGGQHHFANCVEGLRTDAATGGDSSPCSLMFNAADFISLRFGSVNARVIRGYALLYVAANDGSRPSASAPAAAGPGGDDGAGTAGNAAERGENGPARPSGRTLPATGGTEPGAGLAAAAMAAVLVTARGRRRKHPRVAGGHYRES